MAEKTTLYVGALLELSNHWYEKYVNFFINIIEHVFDEVDNNTDILADYSLQLVTKDTELFHYNFFLGNWKSSFKSSLLQKHEMVAIKIAGKSGLAGKRLFELMIDGPPIVAVLGPTLSYELTVVGQITPFYNVLQVSYIALTSSTLTRDFFPTLFMVNQIMDDLNHLRIKMMQYFEWSRAGTLFFQNDIYVSHMNMFHDLLKDNQMTLLTSAVGAEINPNVEPLISRLVHYDVRIIMGTFSGTEAPFVFCEAYRQGLYGKRYVWILAGPVLTVGEIKKLKPEDFLQYGCTYEQFWEAANGHFTLDFDSVDSQNTVTIGNKTPTEVTTTINEMLADTDYKLSTYYSWVYDAAWSVAVGLNNSLKHLNETGLKTYTNHPYYLDAILKGMYEVNFKGISGPVSFDELGKRAGVTYIEQTFNTSRIRVAMYNRKTDILTWFVKPNALWSDDDPPRDMFTYYRVRIPPNIPSLVLIIITNSACLVIAIGFLAFNINYRKNTNIKLSSPNINNVIVAGSIDIFAAVFLTAFDYGHILPESFEGSICMTRVWIMCIGFTCIFGALFSKTWRVHNIFRNTAVKKKPIKDLHLFGILLFLLFIDCVVLAAWSSIHGLRKEIVVRKTKDLLNQNNIMAEVYSYCHHPYGGYWFVAIYIYKGLLLAFGTFLAWETRHVVIPVLSDSKHIGFCIYNVVTVSVFGVPLAHVLPKEQTTLNFVLLSTLVMFCTTMCLCIIFIPKIKLRHQVGGKFLNPALNKTESSIRMEQLGEKILNLSPNIISKRVKVEQQPTSSNTENSKISNYSGDGNVNLNNILELKKDIYRRRMRIEAETIAIERLKRLMLETTDDIKICNMAQGYATEKSKKEQVVDAERSESEGSLKDAKI